METNKSLIERSKGTKKIYVPKQINVPFSIKITLYKSSLSNLPLDLKNGGLNNYKKGTYKRNMRVCAFIQLWPLPNVRLFNRHFINGFFSAKFSDLQSIAMLLTRDSTIETVSFTCFDNGSKNKLVEKIYNFDQIQLILEHYHISRR